MTTAGANPRPGSATSGAPAGLGTVAFLRGDWQIEREISDYRSGQAGWFRGRARFRPGPAGSGPAAALVEPGAAGPGYDATVLDYHESGTLSFGGHSNPAERSLLYRELPDGRTDVRFADGTEFYWLDLRAGQARAEHPCRDDRYLVEVTVLDPNCFTEVWRVTGPAKDCQLAARYTRLAAG